jgi:hypothetical protein
VEEEEEEEEEEEKEEEDGDGSYISGKTCMLLSLLRQTR